MIGVVKCPRCGSTNCVPTHIGDGVLCVPCGYEFNMIGEPEGNTTMGETVWVIVLCLFLLVVVGQIWLWLS